MVGCATGEVSGGADSGVRDVFPGERYGWPVTMSVRCTMCGMRLNHFYELVHHEFGDSRGDYIVDHHQISSLGDTAANLLNTETDVRDIWEKLCDDFEVPQDRRWGPKDLP